ncbi:MAG: glycosyltransferase [Alphaproteobacteria bacterium]|nr:MAG: glycosyltransferase [Alphaproteobacteria bacterium]
MPNGLSVKCRSRDGCCEQEAQQPAEDPMMALGAMAGPLAGAAMPLDAARMRLAGLAGDLADGTFVSPESVQRALVELSAAMDPLHEDARLALVDEILAPLRGSDPAGEVVLAALAFRHSGARAALDRLWAAIEAGEWSAEEENFLHWQMVRLAFLFPQAFDLVQEPRLRRFHRARVMRWNRRINMKCRWLPPERRERRRLMLVSQQFVNAGHAPTRDLLDYARCLRELDFEVEIVISPEMPRELPMAFPEPFLANHVARLDGRRRISFEGAEFDCWQIEGAMPHAKGLSRFLRHVASRRPLVVIGIGGNGIAADLAGRITTTVTLPLAVRPPVSEATFIATIGAEHVDGLGDTAMREELDLAPERFLAFRYAYRLPESGGEVPGERTRLPEDSLLGVIVGNRLDREISGDNLRLLLACLEAAPRLHLVFVGPFDRFEELAAGHPLLAERATALGFQRDVVAVLKRCHLYLNPARAGGGSSVAHALGCGLPVISFTQGDGAFAAGEAFTVATEDDYVARLTRWSTDATALAEARAQAARRWAEISDRRASMAGLMEELGKERLSRPAQLFAREGAGGGNRPARHRRHRRS